MWLTVKIGAFFFGVKRMPTPFPILLLLPSYFCLSYFSPYSTTT